MKTPKSFKLDKRYNTKKIASKKYVPFTLGDLIEFVETMDGIDKDTPLFICDYIDAIEDVVIHPVETVSASSEHSPYLMLG